MRFDPLGEGKCGSRRITGDIISEESCDQPPSEPFHLSIVCLGLIHCHFDVTVDDPRVPRIRRKTFRGYVLRCGGVEV